MVMVSDVIVLLCYNVTAIESSFDKLRPPYNYFINLDSGQLQENGVMHMCTSVGRSINKQVNRKRNT
jgi:hypothetical protein